MIGGCMLQQLHQDKPGSSRLSAATSTLLRVHTMPCSKQSQKGL